MKEEGDILRCIVEVFEVEEEASMYLDSCFPSSSSFLLQSLDLR